MPVAPRAEVVAPVVPSPDSCISWEIIDDPPVDESLLSEVESDSGSDDELSRRHRVGEQRCELGRRRRTGSRRSSLSDPGTPDTVEVTSCWIWAIRVWTAATPSKVTVL